MTSHPTDTPLGVEEAHAIWRDQVTAFSRWERELPKLLGEARFQAVGSMKERRSLFDAYCKAAPDISKRRAESKRAALEAFQALLAEATSLPGAQAGLCCTVKVNLLGMGCGACQVVVYWPCEAL